MILSMTKRAAALLTAVLLLAGLVGTASAGTVYQTEHFELSLPNGWEYDETNNVYVFGSGRTQQRVLLLDLEETQVYRPAPQENLALLLERLGFDQDSVEWEEITAVGQQTVLVRVHLAERPVFYTTIIRYLTHTCYVLYYSVDQTQARSNMLDLLSRLKCRVVSQFGTYRFGDAEAAYLGHRVVSSGGQRYLLLSFSWTNLGGKAGMFMTSVDVKAYQDGIELQPGFLLDVPTETATNIMPGKTLEVTKIFTLRKSTGTITVSVDKLFDFAGTCPDRTYEFTLK